MLTAIELPVLLPPSSTNRQHTAGQKSCGVHVYPYRLTCLVVDFEVTLEAAPAVPSVVPAKSGELRASDPMPCPTVCDQRAWAVLQQLSYTTSVRAAYCTWCALAANTVQSKAKAPAQCHPQCSQRLEILGISFCRPIELRLSIFMFN